MARVKREGGRPRPDRESKDTIQGAPRDGERPLRDVPQRASRPKPSGRASDAGSPWSTAKPPVRPARDRKRGERVFRSRASSQSASEVKPRSAFSARKGAERRHGRLAPFDGKPPGFWGDRVTKTTVIVCAVVAIGSSVAIPTAFAKPTTDITLNDGGRVMDAPTAAATVGEFLEDNRVTIGPEDILEVDSDTPISGGMEIVIRRAMPVTVRTGDESTVVHMVAGTVQDALDRAGVVPAPQDEVYPSPDTYVRAGMNVEHVVVEVRRITDVHPIPYEEIEEEDSGISKGDTEIAQYGEEGELEIITEQIYKNGIMTSEDVISEDVIKEPIAEITKVGTYVPPPPKKKVKTSEIHSGGGGTPGGGTTPDGTPVKNTLTMEVTAYCSNCNHGSKTATGTYPSWGTIAAKTSKLPFGTKLFVPGYGYGRVEDTGGFGADTIDVYMGEQSDESACNGWGRQTLTVYVLE